MDIMPIFVERLDELMSENNMTVTELAKALGMHMTTVYKYLQKSHTPRLETLIKIADYFHCSISYLVGLRETDSTTEFKPCPPFPERFEMLIKQSGKTTYRLCRDKDIASSLIFYWRHGLKLPTIYHLIKIADFLGCSVDYVLGRED